MTPSTPPQHRTVRSQQVDHQARGLVDLTTGDLVVLRHQHEIVTELNHRRNRIAAT